MKFRLAKGFAVAEVAAGGRLYRLDEEAPDLVTWDMDAIAALLDRTGVDAVDEKVEDVVKQTAAVDDRELKAIFHYDRRGGVQKAVEAELEKRHQARLEELAAAQEARAAELAAPVLEEHMKLLEGGS